MFDYQPTFGDNPTARNREPANQQGDWWIGGAEYRPNKNIAAGKQRVGGKPDKPQGTLTSTSFLIIGQDISFLIGGGCDKALVRAELIVNNQVRSECYLVACQISFCYPSISFYFLVSILPRSTNTRTFEVCGTLNTR